MITPDTPDYQRGVVNAQILLASVPGTDSSVVVGIPPNAESLIVAGPAFSTLSGVEVIGTTTHILYPGALTLGTPASVRPAVAIFDVSQPVDSQVTVELATAPGAEWYVYADSGVRCFVDVSRVVDRNGVTYTSETPGSTHNDERPGVGLSYVGANFNEGNAVIASPPAGSYIRLFGCWLTPQPGNTAALQDSNTTLYLATPAGAYSKVSYSPGGVALPEGSNLSVIGPVGSVCTVGAWYIECSLP